MLTCFSNRSLQILSQEIWPFRPIVERHPNGENALVKPIVAKGLHGYGRCMTLNDRSSALSLLETRRSGKPRDLVAPGPSVEEIERILTIATRAPDHGKLSPWRFCAAAARRQLVSL